jgi:hypothetical protein
MVGINRESAMLDLTVEHLGEQRLLDAWPILEMTATELIPHWWQHEATELIRRGGGVLVARASDGLIYGLATYEPMRCSRRKRVLAVQRLITFELSRRHPARQSLLHALDLLAVTLDCSEMALPVRPSRAGPTPSLLAN